MMPQPWTLGDLPRYAAHRFADKIALHSEGLQLSFASLERGIAQVALALSAMGLKRGDRIVLHLPNGWRWIVSYFAIARLGAVVVPANIMLVAGELAYLFADSQAAALIAAAERIKLLQAALPSQRLPLAVPIDEMDEVITAGFRSHERASPELHPPGESADPDDTCTIAYTSGTTGRSKGAVLSHRAVMLNVAMTSTLHVRRSDDVVVTALPCTHVYGNVVMNATFLVGSTLVLLDRFDTGKTLDAIERHRASMFEGVPTMYHYLLGSEELARRDLRSLTRVTVGGQTMPMNALLEVRRRLGCPILELWGMTEIAGLGTTHAAYGPERLGSIGQALPLSECRVVSLEDRGRQATNGEPGELQFRGPTVMRGYHDRPQDTEEVLHDGWLSTGDVARRDEDGYLYVVDRIKEMIITAGYNVYPSEIERVIAEHPAVNMVAVGAVPDAAKGELAAAFIVLKAGQQLEAGEVLDHCRAHLAAYKVPKAIHFVSDLPKTSTGKIVRRALAAWAESIRIDTHH